MNKLAVQNFLNTMDMKIRKGDQIKYAILDSALYHWDNSTYTAVLNGIDQVYAQKRFDELNRENQDAAL